MSSAPPNRPRPVVAAYVAGAALSGAPSTAVALLRGDDPFEAARAAGTLVPPGQPGLVRGVAAHLAISAFWTAVLAVVLPRRRPVVEGAVAGAAIAALDMGVIARRWFPALRALPGIPQLADHVAFGALVGWQLGRAR